MDPELRIPLGGGKRDTAAAEGDETAAEIASQHVENARTFGNHIKEVTEQYQITYIELDRDLEVEKGVPTVTVQNRTLRAVLRTP